MFSEFCMGPALSGSGYRKIENTVIGLLNSKDLSKSHSPRPLAAEPIRNAGNKEYPFIMDYEL